MGCNRHSDKNNVRSQQDPSEMMAEEIGGHKGAPPEDKWATTPSTQSGGRSGDRPTYTRTPSNKWSPSDSKEKRGRDPSGGGCGQNEDHTTKNSGSDGDNNSKFSKRGRKRDQEAQRHHRCKNKTTLGQSSAVNFDNDSE